MKLGLAQSISLCAPPGRRSLARKDDPKNGGSDERRAVPGTRRARIFNRQTTSCNQLRSYRMPAPAVAGMGARPQLAISLQSLPRCTRRMAQSNRRPADIPEGGQAGRPPGQRASCPAPQEVELSQSMEGRLLRASARWMAVVPPARLDGRCATSPSAANAGKITLLPRRRATR